MIDTIAGVQMQAFETVDQAAGDAGEISAAELYRRTVARNVEASAAIMRGDPEPMRKMLDALVRDST